jgi:hypothetical protein
MQPVQLKQQVVVIAWQAGELVSENGDAARASSYSEADPKVIRMTERIANTIPNDWMMVSFSPKYVRAITLTAMSWITAERLNAEDIPTSRTRRNMIRLPTEYKAIVSTSFRVLGPRAQYFAQVAASRKVTVERASWREAAKVT